MKPKIALSLSLLVFSFIHWLPLRSQEAMSKEKSLFLFLSAYATVDCYIKKGKIAASDRQVALEGIASSWGIVLSSVTEASIRSAQLFSARIAPYFGQDCDPNYIPTEYMGSALSQAVEDLERSIPLMRRGDEAEDSVNRCLRAQLERDRAAAGRSYVERNAIEAAYSYRYVGKCIFPPLSPGF